jgi:formate dehydrogenase subunit delta
MSAADLAGHARIASLVRQANRIGDFFAAWPDRAEALDGIASHLHKFWEPRMRRQIYAHLDQSGGEGLSELLLQVLRERRAELGA